MVDYAFYSINALAISFVLFFLFLKKGKNFQFNRFYLLGTLILCLVAPTLEFDYGSNYFPEEKFQLEPMLTTSENIEVIEMGNAEIIQKENFQLKQIFFYSYFLITFLLLIRFAINLFKIIHLIRRSKIHDFRKFKIIDTAGKGNPFSFFNYFFIHNEDLEENNLANSVIQHELAHSKQLHSVDILLSELLSCFFWFNPFIWLYKKEIIQNHEYLADSAVIKSVDLEIYSSHLINCGNSIKQPFISGFSFVKTKNRLNMLHKKQTSKFVLGLKFGIVLILFAAVFAFSSYVPMEDSKPFVVLIDAGHGGMDPGSHNEKEIALAITKQLYELGKKGEIEIILTRETDHFLSLEKRTEIINTQKPNLFLSLHCNNWEKDSDLNGVEAYYSTEGNSPSKVHEYSKILISELLKESFETGKVKTANFLLLRNSVVPGITLHLGYLSNNQDAEKLNDPEHQKQIAQNIYEGLKKIKAVTE
ncbi:MAG TPA: M56/M15 family metallopeptidase [Salinimicrobium sp.]|nr:M56/M15 family metallopeptidase [Salinimicrobium sp.]